MDFSTPIKWGFLTHNTHFFSIYQNWAENSIFLLLWDLQWWVLPLVGTKKEVKCAGTLEIPWHTFVRRDMVYLGMKRNFHHLPGIPWRWRVMINLSTSLHGLGLLHSVWTAALVPSLKVAASPWKKKKSEHISFWSGRQDKLLGFLPLINPLFLLVILNILCSHDWGVSATHHSAECACHVTERFSSVSWLKFPNILTSINSL